MEIPAKTKLMRSTTMFMHRSVVDKVLSKSIFSRRFKQKMPLKGPQMVADKQTHLKILFDFFKYFVFLLYEIIIGGTKYKTLSMHFHIFSVTMIHGILRIVYRTRTVAFKNECWTIWQVSCWYSSISFLLLVWLKIGCLQTWLSHT